MAPVASRPNSLLARFFAWMDSRQKAKAYLRLTDRQWQLSRSEDGTREILICLFNKQFVLERRCHSVESDEYILWVEGRARHRCVVSTVANKVAIDGMALPYLIYLSIPRENLDVVGESQDHIFWPCCGRVMTREELQSLPRDLDNGGLRQVAHGECRRLITVTAEGDSGDIRLSCPDGQ